MKKILLSAVVFLLAVFIIWGVLADTGMFGPGFDVLITLAGGVGAVKLSRRYVMPPSNST